MKTLAIVNRAPLRVFLSKIVDCFDESDVLKLFSIEPVRFHFEIPSFHEDEELKVEERETYYKVKKMIKIEERLERLVIILDKTIHNEKNVNVMVKRIENAMKDIEKIIEIYRTFDNLAKNNFYRESELIEKYLINNENQIDEDLLSTLDILDRYVEIEIKNNHKLGPKEIHVNIFNFMLNNVLEKNDLNSYNEFTKPEKIKKILEISQKIIDLTSALKEYRNAKYPSKIEEYDF